MRVTFALVSLLVAIAIVSCTPTVNTPPTRPPASSSAALESESIGPSDNAIGEASTGVPTSVSSGPKAPCGGLAGSKCPEGSTCVDDPADACDPKTGAGGCAGVCVSLKCGAGASCPAGYKCSEQSTCIEVKLATCGGLDLKQCPGGTRCIDDATDGCDPKTGGVSCPGFCMPE